jgi:hypothetical protein
MLRVFEKSVLRRGEVIGGWSKLYSEEFINIFSFVRWRGDQIKKDGM